MGFERIAGRRRRLSAGAPADWICVWLVGALVAASLVDIFRLGLFADDFIFLDALRRQTPLDVLLGRHGIWPWYRPLSRELLFAVANAFGVTAAHALALGAVWLAADSLRRVVARRLGPTAAAASVVLFVIHSLTHFLTGWLSGLQDLLAVTLSLVAIRLQQQGRLMAAVCCAGLAPFAKETGFLAYPLLAVDAVLGERRALSRREIVAYCVAGGLALLIHLLVRITWPTHTPSPAPPKEPGDLPGAMLHALIPWSAPPGPAAWLAWSMGAVAMVIAFVLLERSVREPGPASPPRPLWAPAALVISSAPALAMGLAPLEAVRAHFFFPAIPWLCALAGWAVARWRPNRLGRTFTALACGVLVWSGSARPVSVDELAGWQVGPLGWSEAQRIEARTRRLEHGVRALLAARPESLLVAYEQVPFGTWFQTGDGPATRVVLDDPTVRAYFVSNFPEDELRRPRPRVALLDYDPVGAHGFVRIWPDNRFLVPNALRKLFAGETTAARLFTALAASERTNKVFPIYMRAAVNLVVDGDVGSFAKQWAAGGGDSSVGDSVAAPSTPIGVDDPRADAAIRMALAHPLSPAAHHAAAEELRSAGLPVLEALELSVAVRLDSTRAEDALRLAYLLASTMPAAAQGKFQLAGVPRISAAMADSARRTTPP